LQNLRALRPAPGAGAADVRGAPYEIYVRAKLDEAAASRAFTDTYSEALRDAMNPLNDRAAYELGYRLQTHPDAFRGPLRQTLEPLKDKDRITLDEAQRLVRAFVDWRIASETFALTDAVLSADSAQRYIVKEDVLIKTKDGATLSAIV